MGMTQCIDGLPSYPIIIVEGAVCPLVCGGAGAESLACIPQLVFIPIRRRRLSLSNPSKSRAVCLVTERAAQQRGYFQREALAAGSMGIGSRAAIRL